jgi:hypothetical protein
LSSNSGERVSLDKHSSGGKSATKATHAIAEGRQRRLMAWLFINNGRRVEKHVEMMANAGIQHNSKNASQINYLNAFEVGMNHRCG